MTGKTKPNAKTQRREEKTEGGRSRSLIFLRVFASDPVLNSRPVQPAGGHMGPPLRKRVRLSVGAAPRGRPGSVQRVTGKFKPNTKTQRHEDTKKIIKISFSSCLCVFVLEILNYDFAFDFLC